MVRISDIEVQFLVEGKAVTEHVDPQFIQEAQPNVASKYIEATSGLAFRTHAIVHKEYAFAPAIGHLSFKMHVDGQLARHRVMLRSFCEGNTSSMDIEPLARVEAGNQESRAMVFGDMKIVGNPITTAEVYEQIEKHKELGEVRVKVWRIAGSNSIIRNRKEPVMRPTRVSVHEKTVVGSAVSLAATIGPTAKELPKKVYRGKKADYAPIATFIFKYRTKAALQNLGIIKRTPSPPLYRRNPDELNFEQCREAVRMLQARLEANVNERDADRPPATVNRKRAGGLLTPVATPAKKQRREVNGVVELSDSD